MRKLSNEKIKKNIEKGYVDVEQNMKVEFFFSIEEYNRLERIVEAYGLRDKLDWDTLDKYD